MAMMLIGQLLLAPSAAAATTAFSKAGFVMMSEGRRFSCTMPTMRCPVRNAIQPRSLCGPGMAAQPGSDMPRTSASEFMLSAVPIVLQCPALDALAATISMNCS